MKNFGHRSFRTHFLLGFAVCAGLLGYALYLQLHQGLEPCPLCIFQRMAFAALALIFLLGGLHAPQPSGPRQAYGGLAVLAAMAGIGVAGRHVWLQQLPPDQVPSCGPPLEFMRETMGTFDLVRKVLIGSGDCANVDWSFLGLSMPAWSLVWFGLLAGWAAWAAFGRR